MKRQLICTIACATAMLSTGQTPTNLKGFRLPRDGKRVVVYELDGNDGYKSLPRTLEYNTYFKPIEGVEKEIGGATYQLVFVPPFKDSTLNFESEASYRSKPYNRIWNYDGRKKWWVKTADVERALPVYPRWNHDLSLVVGALTLPTVVRPRRGDTPLSLDADASLGTSIGIRMGISELGKRALNVVGFAAIKSIKHTSSNNTAIEEGGDDVDGSGIAVGAGLALDWDGLQTGIFFGCDKASGTLGKDYVYQDALWIGFGIGVNLFVPTKGAATEKNK